jgi:hypothetical protein
LLVSPGSMTIGSSTKAYCAVFLSAITTSFDGEPSCAAISAGSIAAVVVIA